MEEHGEYAATLFVLQRSSIAAKAAPFIDQPSRAFHWEGLVAAARSWSSGEQLLVRTAQDLWNSAGGVHLKELAGVLDDVNYAVILEALAHLRGRNLAVGSDPERLIEMVREVRRSPDPPSWATKAGEPANWRRAALVLAREVAILAHQRSAGRVQIDPVGK